MMWTVREAAEAYLRAWCEARGEAWDDQAPYVRDMQISTLERHAQALMAREAEGVSDMVPLGILPDDGETTGTRGKR